VSAPSPLLSVVVPVLREEGRIGAAVEALLAEAAGLPVETIVVDGDPAGSTLSALGDAPVRKMTAPPGRGSQLAAGAAAARGEVLLFLHADTRLPRGAFREILAAVDGGAPAGFFRLSIEGEGIRFRIVEGGVALRCRLFRLPYGDQALFVTRGAYRRAGGFPPWPVMEDVELVRRLKRAGSPPASLPSPVRTSPRRWERDGVAARTFRNWTLLFRYLLGASPEALAREYR
jgi:rSAM/selenodomain-associated transferase 2